MSSLLEALITFVGVMMVLALVAQSLQEVIKAAFAIKGRTMLRALEGLVREAVRSQGQWSIDAQAIMNELRRRLSALGQKGFGQRRLRLDELPADKLRDLIAKVEPKQVPGLPVGEEEAKTVLAAIAEQAQDWYPLAIAPVDGRYRRRMRALALLASVLVVVPFNAGADRVFGLARTDRMFRDQVAALVKRYDSLAAHPQVAEARGSEGEGQATVPDTVETNDTTVTPDSTAVPSASGRDSRAVAPAVGLTSQLDGLMFFDQPTTADFRRTSWWLGIAFSVFLVSLGAPFWHDLLETLFGLKNRIQAQAAAQAQRVNPKATTTPP